MPSIKEYDIKLKSLKSTRKITKTMKMVAASKLQKAHRAQANARLYARHVTALISRISAAVGPASHPLLTPRAAVRNIHILMFTSDKGLCGAFNHNANRRVLGWIEENRERYGRIDLSFCGKKAAQFFQKNEFRRKDYSGVIDRPQFTDAIRIGQDLGTGFLKGEHDEVYLVFNQFFNPLVQKTVFEKILPIEPQALVGESGVQPREYIFEPATLDFLEYLISHFLYFKIYFSLLENSAGEHGARMSAMDSASKNAAEFIDRYSLLRNRARQDQITKEITEITAGAEALK